MNEILNILTNKKGSDLQKYAEQKPIVDEGGAVERTRTSTVLLPLEPESSALKGTQRKSYPFRGTSNRENPIKPRDFGVSPSPSPGATRHLGKSSKAAKIGRLRELGVKATRSSPAPLPSSNFRGATSCNRFTGQPCGIMGHFTDLTLEIWSTTRNHPQPPKALS
ncbi:hypothetical protein [Cohnella sp. 56]|uniref:hypothetical protein n=1 Tax=Cohnella sp. 56 TaxID=3113722 RepID=UPI0030F3E404